MTDLRRHRAAARSTTHLPAQDCSTCIAAAAAAAAAAVAAAVLAARSILGAMVSPTPQTPRWMKRAATA